MGNLEIRKVKVSSLKYAPYNPRKISQETLLKLERSIREFGLVEPLVVNRRNMHVVGGNQRLAVLKKMGIEEVDAVFVDLDDAREKALNIALNKICGEWDLEILKDLLLELDSGIIDISLTGFDALEIEELMNNLGTPYDVEELLHEADLSKAVARPAWVVMRFDKSMIPDVEAALSRLPAGIRIERSYEDDL